MKMPAWQRREDLFLVPWGGWLLMAAILLSVFLAGGRPLWAQGVISLLIGLLWLIRTPERLPTKPVVIMLAALAVVPLTAYLPGWWLAMPSWRAALADVKAITPSDFVTPQPWLTLHCYLLWLTGLGLAAWCACQQWDHYHRGTLARMYAGGLLAIALFAIFGYVTGYQPPWWISTDGFGPFINRNQWGSALGFAGVVSIALIHQCVRQGHKQGVLFWLIATAVFTVSIIANGSRGGLVMLAGGGFAYWGLYGLLRKQYRYAAIGLTFLLVSFSLFAMGGGELLERFVGLRSLTEEGWEGDTRVQFYRMTTALVAGSPLVGFGLGNFEYVLPFYLDYEPLFDRRPIHPESSWLWLASEGGWLLLVAMAIAVVVLMLRGYSARKSRAATIRAVGMACALMLAFNSTFEVSGHRIGTLFPVILLAALALPPAEGLDLGRVTRTLAKAFGTLLALTGLVWLLGGWGVPFVPSVQGIEPLQHKATVAEQSGRREDAIELLKKCEPFRPLDWNIHWTLSNQLLAQGQIHPAWEQFVAANELLPYLYWTIQDQAVQWIEPAPGRAAAAMLEAMSRAPAPKRAAMYANFLQGSKSNDHLRAVLLRFYPDDPEMEFVRIAQAAPDVAAKRLSRMLVRTDKLSSVPDHLVVPVLRFMLQSNHTAEIDRVVADNNRLKRLGWEVLVDREINKQQVKEALDIYFNYGPHPAIPAALSRSDLRSVERAAAMAPMDIATAIAYYQALAVARRDDDAFWQLRRIMESPQAPPYIWFLAAQAAHRRGEHGDAWGYLEIYRKKTAK